MAQSQYFRCASSDFDTNKLPKVRVGILRQNRDPIPSEPVLAMISNYDQQVIGAIRQHLSARLVSKNKDREGQAWLRVEDRFPGRQYRDVLSFQYKCRG